MPKRERRDLAAVLLRRAEDDQFVVRELRGSPRTPDSVPGFHAQQAAEKLIKAAAFANAKGGTLIIGVNDDGKPVGLEKDLALMSKPDVDR